MITTNTDNTLQAYRKMTNFGLLEVIERPRVFPKGNLIAKLLRYHSQGPGFPVSTRSRYNVKTTSRAYRN